MSALSEPKRAALRPYVEDCTVHDLGAGDLTESIALLEIGAERVFAIDRHPMPDPPPEYRDRIRRRVEHFENWGGYGYINVALLSFPVNWDSGVLRLLERSKTIIYHGKCTDGTMCGYPAMWEHLIQRQVLVHVHDRAGVLIVYGDESVVRSALPEELCGIDRERVWRYEEAYGEHQP